MQYLQITVTFSNVICLFLLGENVWAYGQYLKDVRTEGGGGVVQRQTIVLHNRLLAFGLTPSPLLSVDVICECPLEWP